MYTFSIRLWLQNCAIIFEKEMDATK